jgi:hypothetical protein
VRRSTPKPLTLAVIASRMELPLLRLRGVAEVAASSYRTKFQPKPSGGRRLIAAPSDELKVVQRRILDSVLYRLPSVARGDSVFGRNSVRNAKSHRGYRHTTSLDVKDAFPSVRRKCVFDALRREGFSNDAATLLCKLCLLNESLPQGAPTSAALLGLVIQPIHARLIERFGKTGLHYTRYADNLTISGPGELGAAERAVVRELRLVGLKINLEKTQRGGRTLPVVITGVETGRAAKVPPHKMEEFRGRLAEVVGKDGDSEISVVGGILSWVRQVNEREARRLYTEAVPKGSAMRVALRARRRGGRRRRSDGNRD